MIRSASSTNRRTSSPAGTIDWIAPTPCPAGKNSRPTSTSVPSAAPRWLAPAAIDASKLPLNLAKLHQKLKESTETADPGKLRFKVLAGDVADVRASKNSIMPDGLLDVLTDQEIRDLLAYLEARK